MLFSDIFLSRWWPGCKLTDITICKSHQGSTRQTESVNQRAGCRKLNNIIIHFFNINKICGFEKENTVFTDSKDRQVKHYYPNKKAVTLSIGSGQKEKNFWGFKEISNLSFKYMEFVLTRNHFCNWCWSSNYWDFFNRKKSSCLNRSYWNSCGSFIS